MPRKAFKKTMEQSNLVRTTAGYGLTQEMIARLVISHERRPISVETLVKYFAEELAEGKAQAAAKVSQTSFALATSGDCPAMTMFWLKTQLRWKEVHVHEHTGEDGGPIEQVTSNMTEKQAAEAYARTLNRQRA